MPAPIINDVATDLANPPEFVKRPELNPLPEAFKKQISDFYTDLKPLELQCTVAEGFEACKRAAGTMPRWSLTHEDASAGVLEGVATTRILRFKDDFVIRVAEHANGVKVDMRSKSRLGKGDLGANAARIQSYFDAVRKEAQQTRSSMLHALRLLV
eukprot:TRINITY_DN32893_c0_g3_i1.p1 TRINITY_DN32893_c0_g3~~TRINITY_DN32893_c0_g3_i1.p1  ORF type:complete len:156 (+),score=17.43 TRINITY_DN32893_c0_g3_i1:191-658(+)